MALLFLLVAEPYLVLALKSQMIHLAFITTATASGVYVVPIQPYVFVTLALAVAVVLVGALAAPVAIMVAAFALAGIVACVYSAQRIRRKNNGKKQKYGG